MSVWAWLAIGFYCVLCAAVLLSACSIGKGDGQGDDEKWN